MHKESARLRPLPRLGRSRFQPLRHGQPAFQQVTDLENRYTAWRESGRLCLGRNPYLPHRGANLLRYVAVGRQIVHAITAHLMTIREPLHHLCLDERRRSLTSLKVQRQPHRLALGWQDMRYQIWQQCIDSSRPLTTLLRPESTTNSAGWHIRAAPGPCVSNVDFDIAAIPPNCAMQGTKDAPGARFG
jgi:hypothetical protein